MTRASVTVEKDSTEINKTQNETSCTILVIGSFDRDCLDAIERTSIVLVDNHVDIKNVGTAQRYKIITIGGAARCSAIVRAIENSVKGNLVAMLVEIGSANALLDT